MRLGLLCVALVAMTAPAALAAQPLTPQPMVVPGTGPHVGYSAGIVPGAPCAHGYCGPHAYNAFSACGCSGCGTHAGGYGCCPKPACDGSIWTSTYYPRSRNLHLWDTYCADTTPCPYTGHDMKGLYHTVFGPCHKHAKRGCRQGHCQLHSYHRQPQFTMPVSFASGGIHLDPAAIPHMEPEAAVAPAAPAVEEAPAPENLQETAPAPPAVPRAEPALEAPAAPPAPPAAPLLSPDAVELTPAVEGPAGLDAPPAPTADDAVEAPAPRL